MRSSIDCKQLASQACETQLCSARCVAAFVINKKNSPRAAHGHALLLLMMTHSKAAAVPAEQQVTMCMPHIHTARACVRCKQALPAPFASHAGGQSTHTPEVSTPRGRHLWASAHEATYGHPQHAVCYDGCAEFVLCGRQHVPRAGRQRSCVLRVWCGASGAC